MGTIIIFILYQTGNWGMESFKSVGKINNQSSRNEMQP